MHNYYLILLSLTASKNYLLIFSLNILLFINEKANKL